MMSGWNHNMCRQHLYVGLLAVNLFVVGCGYGEVSPRGYDHALALYSICNRRDESRLAEYAQMVESESLEGRISDQETEWIREIVGLAQQGDWQTASRSIRQLMEDQIREP